MMGSESLSGPRLIRFPRSTVSFAEAACEEFGPDQEVERLDPQRGHGADVAVVLLADTAGHHGQVDLVLRVDQLEGLEPAAGLAGELDLEAPLLAFDDHPLGQQPPVCGTRSESMCSSYSVVFHDR